MNKAYKITGIKLAALLGGPLAAGYLISENFKSLDKPDLAKSSLYISILVLFGFIFFMFAIPEKVVNAIPSILFPVIFALVSQVIVDKYQSHDLKEFWENGGLKHSNWRAAGMALILAIISFVIIFIAAFLLADLIG